MSTHVYASAVIAAPIDTVWNELRDFTSPSRLFSSTIDQVKMDDGASPTQVGGNRTVVWKNGVQRKHKLLELSDAVCLPVIPLFSNFFSVEQSAGSCCQEVMMKWSVQ
eukprot:TRINITY_DN119_c0_g2_i1.p1 TRINITY_DN119_c0_g2~~TRINITY_DN119_c0_g2_i1.p1  ORF type:complete len:108 (+),score=7.92 TRINITY_DN119_c0_g2_i1:110-433(+)